MIQPALEDLLSLADRDPQQAEHEALNRLRAAEADGDSSEQIVAQRVLGAVAGLRGEADEAVSRLSAARDVALRCDEGAVVAEIDIQLAGPLSQRGDTSAALELIETAEPCLDHVWSARAMLQRAVICQRLGDQAAAEMLDEAVRRLAAVDDARMLASAVCNRGLLHWAQGRLDAAAADLTRASELHRASGNQLRAEMMRHNLGLVVARRGDIPAALDTLQAAADALSGLGVNSPVVMVDRAEVHLAAGLAEEAAALSTAAADAFHHAGDLLGEAEAHLLAAQAKLAGGDREGAGIDARRAESSFREQERPAWADAAAAIGLQCHAAPGAAEAEDGAALARRLGDAGWAAPALEAALTVADIAERTGDPVPALAALAGADRWRRDQPAAVRAQAWHATARRHVLAGEPDRARSCLHAAADAARDAAQLIGATDLRARAAATFDRMAQLAIRVALGAGDPAEVITWSERFRSLTDQVTTRSVQSADDPELDALLAELRGITSQLQAGTDPTPELRRRQLELEDAAVVRLRKQRAEQAGGRDVDVDPGEVVSTVGSRHVVYLVEVDGDVWSVVFADGHAQVHGPVSASTVAAELGHLHFSLERATRVASNDPRHLQEALHDLELSGVDFDDLIAPLLGPVALDHGSGEDLVVVSSPTSANVPWAVLPSIAERAVAVVPSLASALQPPPPPPRRLVALGGPDVETGTELDVAADHYPAAAIHPRATVDDAIDAFATADVVHLAAHGTFRSDNPTFSALHLHDGALHLWELDRLPRVSPRAVLTACDIALTWAPASTSFLGAAGLLHSRGCRGLIAGIAPVADVDLAGVVDILHHALASGATCAEALRDMRTAATDPHQRLAGTALAAFGTA